MAQVLRSRAFPPITIKPALANFARTAAA